MAVRFLPAPSEEPAASKPDRKNLAEVIELRSLLRQQEWKSSATDDVAEAPAAPEPTRARIDVSVLVSGPWAGVVADPADEDDESVAQPATEEPLPDISEQAVKMLARKAKSSGELQEELLRAGYEAVDVEVVIGEFEQNLYLDDAGLARAVTEKLRDSKRASKSQIRVKLKARRLPDSVIEAALGELDDDEEFALLRATAVERARRMQDLDRATAERRLLGFLARRGWSGEPATRAVRDALNGAGGAGGGVRFR
ncbi:regulatory protein RecX [Leucobacter viscericola]|uniref:Regulatory protein RecX n=1 Tax=Leucobacter viscericola TaxID=2714935 RepID=A0A6G7XDH5_9MICO|nr:regulatory protein RecX [Leucobacter viscericola]QIK62428.1 regulatory protein RecX [Leucobacter viscericola]